MSPARVSSGRLAIVLLAVVAHLAAGCTAIGVRPDPGDYLDEAKQQCQVQHLPADDLATYRACLDYEQAFDEASGYINAYMFRAKLNSYAIYIGGVLALASVGALAGLGAFGLAGSDAAKIIPLAGTFVGGVLAYSNNEDKETAYVEAANILWAAVAERSSRALLNRDAPSYRAAAVQLKVDIALVERTLSVKLREAASAEARKAMQLKEAEKRIKQAKAFYYSIVSVTPAPGTTPTEANVRLSSPVAQIWLDFKDIEVRIDGTAAPIKNVQQDTLIVEIPPVARGQGAHPVQVYLDEMKLPAKGTLNYP